ncbi:uncharacterized protein BO97DRAFT_419149 [Aspergillus homomorphus CBS 101889]|uniref:Uncharacterized protein n=1 Tax=Aspergillus homomorphus (strain CBS 101889) TaxID=1450537 RepID=A0A395HKI7_ASPHC|nr:hypothetical protein BO97DRAFT_419149 [Aspergillus homomorphus CBS 101889]RAL06774.1 hypothetical protein BO97DRAFT_419149 [Aspergillus homomorphus CBS 101889]
MPGEGPVSIILLECGCNTVVLLGGNEISSGCSNTLKIKNWNIWVGSVITGNAILVKPTLLADKICVEGWGKGNFTRLYELTYSLGDPGLSYNSNCLEGVCGIVEVPLTIPTISLFTPDTCTAGTGSGVFTSLCSYGCNVGYCFIHNCTCTATGPLNVPAAANTSITSILTVGGDSGLYNFTYNMDPYATDDRPNPECVLSEIYDFSQIFAILDMLEAAVDMLQPACTFTVYYQLVDVEGFYSDLLADYGIDQSWVQFGTQELDEPCTPAIYKTGCVVIHCIYAGFLVKAADSAITVANPKKIMAVKKKEMINKILMGVLLIVSFLGELEAVADVFVGLSRIIMMISDVGIGVIMVYVIVDNPKMALLTILEILLLGGIYDLNEFAIMGSLLVNLFKSSKLIILIKLINIKIPVYYYVDQIRSDG